MSDGPSLAGWFPHKAQQTALEQLAAKDQDSKSSSFIFGIRQSEIKTILSPSKAQDVSLAGCSILIQIGVDRTLN